MNYENYKVLVDGMNIAYRVSFIFDNKVKLSTEGGAPTGTVFGFLKHMLKLRNRFPGADFYVAWEGLGSLKARQEIYPEYKADRTSKEIDLESLTDDADGPAEALISPLFLQLPKLSEALEALGVHQASAKGYEADDVLGTLAQEFEEQGHKVVIVTADRDLLQVVSDNVVLMTPKEKFYDPSRVAEEYNVESPCDLLTYRSLDGDKSDNLPGLFRFPRKKIAALVNEHHDLESIYTHREMELTEFQTRTLDEFEDQAFRNRAVMGLQTVEDYDLRKGEYDGRTIEAICSQLEFESMQDDLKAFPVKTGFVKTGKSDVDLLHPTTGPTGAGQPIFD